MTARVAIIDGKPYLVGASGPNGKSAQPKSPHLDKDEVKRAAAGRWVEILSDVGGISVDYLNGIEGPCPKCSGTTRFRLLDEQAGAVRCSHCFKQKCGDGIAAIMWMRGVSFVDALQLIAEYLDVQPSTNTNQATGNGSSQATTFPDAGLPTNPIDAIAKLKRIPRDALVAFGAQPMGVGSIFLPAYGPDGRECTNFRIWVDGDEKQKKGKFTRGKPAGIFLPHEDDGKPRLPTPGQTGHLAEGFKDAAALHAIGFYAVGLPTSSLTELLPAGSR